MRNSATAEGTRRFADRFRARAASGHFRETRGLVLPSLGIGTYLGQPDAKTDESYTAAVVAAAESGIHLIDTAINYRFQRSERSIRAALDQLARKGFQRDEVVLCTKGGYLTPVGQFPVTGTDNFNANYTQKAVSGRRATSPDGNGRPRVISKTSSN